MKNISPYRYPGSKNKLLPILSEYISGILWNQDNFSDGFVGGGSAMLYIANKYPNIQLFGNDKDSWIASFWQIVSGNDSSKFEALLTSLRMQPTIDLFYKLSQTPPITDLEQAYYSIFFNRTCFSGIVKRDSQDRVKSTPIGGKDQKSKWKIDCRYNFKKLKEKIIHCRELLSGRTKIECSDFSNYDILMNTNYPIYLDAPYVKKGDMLYHESMSLKDHEKLAAILQNRSNWVASYDDCLEIRDLYKQNKIIDLAARYSINGKKTQWESKNELIITPNA